MVRYQNVTLNPLLSGDVTKAKEAALQRITSYKNHSKLLTITKNTYLYFLTTNSNKNHL